MGVVWITLQGTIKFSILNFPKLDFEQEKGVEKSKKMSFIVKGKSFLLFQRNLVFLPQNSKKKGVFLTFLFCFFYSQFRLKLCLR